ncbi:MAG: hypothetical protein KDD66_04305 [Bdellovibrionales bacterium]|nr:hypothetical protein [Bdellovibrionales bacterium]
MKRRKFLQGLSATALPLATGCSYMRIDPWHFRIRSPYFTSIKHEKEVLNKANLFLSDDGKVRILVARGNAYERGYQQGALLRDEVQENLEYIYNLALKKFYFEELFAEVYERMRPFIPQEYVDEMHGLAHGARLPLKLVHHLHILPAMGEWGGKRQVKKVIKQMMKGAPEEDWDLGTSCSNFSLAPATTSDGNFYVIRILDWGLHRISKLHEFPLVTVNIPEKGIASANIGWVGFLGAVSGINAQGITLGEMGYGDPDNETLAGVPMIFLLRDVLSYSSNLADVRRIISSSPGTNSFGYVMTDGKTGEGELYIRDRDRFVVFKAGQEARDKNEFLPAIADVSYGGHYEEKMAELLAQNRGSYSLEMIQNKLIPELVMKSNFQNVIYEPRKLQIWVNNAKDRSSLAADSPYTHIDLAKILREA